MVRPTSVDELRKLAQKYRTLSRSLLDERIIAALDALAEEYERIARKYEEDLKALKGDPPQET